MFRTLLIISFLFISTTSFTQQKYHTGLGLRGGYPSGISGKQFLNDNNAVEGILSFGWGGVGLTALYQIHVPMTDAPGFNWYYGIGGHIASAKESKGNPFSKDTGDKFFLGVDGVFGVEYVFPDLPISLSLDAVPFVSILPSIYPWFNVGLSVRYVFK